MVKVVGSNRKHKVLVYALSTCIWCKQVKSFLKSNDIEYGYVDVDLSSKEDQEKIRKHIYDLGGRFSFPTIIIDEDNLITGHHEDRLRRVLET
ncbi:MAG: glutaredoxin family protein [Promethearchaeota archaeon]